MEAEEVFETLKAGFTTAPVLAHPDPSLAFIVEVDVSKVGVGAMLSQHTGIPPKVWPCAFYSKQLCPAKRTTTSGTENSWRS